MSVNMSGSGTVGLGVGVGSYQPGVCVPLKALFLVCAIFVIYEQFKFHAQLSKGNKMLEVCQNGLVCSHKK